MLIFRPAICDPSARYRPNLNSADVGATSVLFVGNAIHIFCGGGSGYTIEFCIV